MGWFAWLIFLLFVAVICFGIFLFLADCDMSLLWNLKYGKSPDSLAGKVVWIWGATSGLGEALAVELAKRGCKLVLSGYRGKELKEIRDKCLGFGTIRKEDILCDFIHINDPTTHKSTVDRVVERFQQVDIVINDVRGIFQFQPKWSHRTDKINLFEPVSLTKAVLPHMPSNGQYVLTQSVSGKLLMAVQDGLTFKTLLKRDMDTCFDSSKTKGRPENVPLTVICAESVSGDPSLGRRGRKIAPNRITQLAAVAIANRLFEAWIVAHPGLAYFYLFHYLPFIGKKIEKWL